ncbi:MAG: Crp/Fnr family transcriptional regulator [Clostridia bacterium]|nr:Crp/Fnr family transcriptional regulator [Clostridia bacterium]
MTQFLPILMQSPLFASVQEEELAGMLTCLGARSRTYRKGDLVLRQGDRLQDVAVLVEGALHIQQDDYWGNRHLLAHIGVGDLFGEAYAAPDSGAFPNDAVAVEDSTVLFFEVRRLLTACSSACPFHTKVIENLFYAISAKNRQLVQKLGHMSRRSTRDKLLSYLSEQAKVQGSGSFSIPFNRQQLADYLSVDRSAMSNTLCKLRDEGWLRFRKNGFTLLRDGRE